jgi:thymidylate synthase (FAD)
LRVELIARTRVTPEATEVLDTQVGADHVDYLAEFAGRACYQAWDRPNPKTRENADYLRSIIGKGHESVLEHASFTFYITGVSRSLSHELIRHRHLSFSELSQRYVDMAEAEIVMPPAYRDLVERAAAASGVSREQLEQEWQSSFDDLREDYEDTAALLAEHGFPRKQAREAARCVMPNATETRLVVSGNVRAWRHVIRLRGSEHADAEIRELAIRLLDILYDEAPGCFYDFSVVELDDGRKVIE